MIKITKEIKKELEEKKPEVKNGTKGSCGCGCTLPLKAK